MGKKLKDISPKDAVIEQSSDTLREKAKTADKKTNFGNRSKASKKLFDIKTEGSQETVQHSFQPQENNKDYNQEETVPISDKESRATDDSEQDKVEPNSKSENFMVTKTNEILRSEPFKKLTQTTSYHELFTFNRGEFQFGIPVQNVKEVIRSNLKVNALPVNMPGCIGSITYREKLIPVYECLEFAREVATDRGCEIPKQSSLILVGIEEIDVCFTIDRHIDVISVQTEKQDLFTEYQSDNKYSYIKHTLGYKNSNLVILSLERVWADVKINRLNQNIVDVTKPRTENKASNASNFKEFIYARIDDFHFVVEIAKVVEIIQGFDVTPVYGQNKFVRGLINLRGQVLACIDISIYLGCSGLILDERNKYLVLKHENQEFALCIDEVFGMRSHDLAGFSNSSLVLADEIAELFPRLIENNAQTILELSVDSIIQSSYLEPFHKEKLN